MITTCTECQARYQLDADRIPPKVIKVRCPSCNGVFSLDGTKLAKPEPMTVSSGYEGFKAPNRTPVAPERPEAPAVESPVQSAPEPAAAAVETPAPAAGVAVMDSPREPSGRRRRSKEEMLARALVSDIMVYNNDLYESAKAEGNLLEALGAEIKKSWELYKEKVTPEVANGSEHFRNALNDILADGEKIF